jgi:hypothetical protein
MMVTMASTCAALAWLWNRRNRQNRLIRLTQP